MNTKSMSTEYPQQNIGHVISVNNGLLFCSAGLACFNEELVIINNKYKGVVCCIKEEKITIAVIDRTHKIVPGDVLMFTGEHMGINVSTDVLGRVIDILGDAIDDMPPLKRGNRYSIMADSPSMMDRQNIETPALTGCKIIDSLIPIGQGQRELIVGSQRHAGKPRVIAMNAVVHQARMGSICVYVAIGLDIKKISSTIKYFKEHQVFNNIVIVVGSAESAISQVKSPYAGCTVAEYFMHRGNDVFIVYDDLSRHAWSYRQIALLMGYKGGRKAYPGDIFSMHATLLERSANINSAYIFKKSGQEQKRGSMTAMPIVITESSDTADFIVTNVMSITDGQIIMCDDLASRNIYPAINISSSVSRVGKKAQTPLMRSLSGNLRIAIARIEAISNFYSFTDDNIIKEDILKLETIRNLLYQEDKEPAMHHITVLSLLCVHNDSLLKMLRSYNSHVINRVLQKLGEVFKVQYEDYYYYLSVGNVMCEKTNDAIVSIVKQHLNDHMSYL